MNDPTESSSLRESVTEKLNVVRKQAPVWLRLIAIVAIPLLVLGYLGPQLADYARDRSDTWLQYERHLVGPADDPKLQHPSDLGAAVTERLDHQLRQIRTSAHYHLTVSKNFFAYHFLTITIATFAAIIAGVLLVPISWTGWKDASPGLTTFFLLFAAVGILAVTFGQVYRQAENVEDNLSLYYGYLNLEDEFMSYYPVRLADEKSIAAPHKFIQAVDKRIAELRGFAVAFDASKIPTAREVYNQLNVPLAEEVAEEK